MKFHKQLECYFHKSLIIIFLVVSPLSFSGELVNISEVGNEPIHPSIKTAHPPEAFTENDMTEDFSASGLPFKAFGLPSFDEADKKFPCHLLPDQPRSVFDLLVNWSTHNDASSAYLYIHDICRAEYMPLGGKRYLVRYRGIGVVDLSAGRYSRLYGPWVDIDFISKLSKVDSSTSIAIYQTDLSKGDGSSGYYALLIHEVAPGKFVVSYADLFGKSGYVDNEDDELVCPDIDDAEGNSATTATVILPSITTAHEKTRIKFIIKTKNCNTGHLSTETQEFEYIRGILTDMAGKIIQFQNFE